MKLWEYVGGLVAGLVLVVLGGRALAYAATPTPLAAEIGGPRLPVIAFVSLAIAIVLALGVLWLAALGVRERYALDPAPGPAPRLGLRRFGLDAGLLGGSSLLVFAALETWIHGRAGMHMRWWQCLDGPVHRNAVPILLALALAAAALLGALRHALAWARRVVSVLRRLLQPRPARRPRAVVLGELTAPAWLLARALRARGPPVLSIP
jgi:hypothetical protein